MARSTKIRSSFALLISTLAFASSAMAGLEAMTLKDVYALPVPELEQLFMAGNKESCEGLISAVTVGKNDPAKLSRAEFCAVQHYSNSGYMVNRPLWATGPDGSGLTGDDWAYVRVLDAALAKIKSVPPTTVYRGTSTKELKFTKKGEIVRLKGYSSTTPNKDVAEGFIRDRLMVIKVLSGKNIKPYSNAGGEDELLLPRSTRVRFERSETKTLEIFTDDGPEKRKVEIVYLTEVK